MSEDSSNLFESFTNTNMAVTEECKKTQLFENNAIVDRI